MKNLLNLANAITVLGIILAVWANSVAFFNPDQIWLIAFLVFLTGITDKADGYIARKYKIETQIGGFLDRMRDKLLICPLLVILILKRPMNFNNDIVSSLWKGLIYLTLLLEIILIIIGIVGLVKKMDTASNKYGKKKMFFQFFTVLIWVAYIGLEKSIPQSFFIMRGLIYLVVTLLLISVIYGLFSINGYLEKYT